MRHFRPPKQILLVILCLLVLGLAMVGFVLAHQTAPERLQTLDTMYYIPDYPSAEQVQIELAEKDDDGRYEPYEPLRTVAFVTTDTPDRVFTFYKDALRRVAFEKWQVDTAEQALGDPLGYFRVYGTLPDAIPAPIWIFVVRTEQAEGQTRVTVERSYMPGR